MADSETAAPVTPAPAAPGTQLTANGTASAPKPRQRTASPRHCGPNLDTKERLFGGPATPKRPQKNTATFKSNIFNNNTPPQSPAKSAKKQIPVIERNPITGEVKVPPRVTV